MTTPSDSAWPPGSEDAIGQACEFLVWAALIGQSAGGLHVFLPMLDRGIDALLHRLRDGAYIAIQVKGKTSFRHGEAPIAVYENHLFTDDQLIVGVNLDGDRLGPFALVADTATFKRKAAHMVDRGRTMLVADIPFEPTPGHKWTEDLVPISALAERIGGASGPQPERIALAAELPSEEDRVGGFQGELEVCRRLGMLEGCGLFRPFPDNELSEVVVRRLVTGSTLGLQVKTALLDEPHAYRHVLINRASFVPAPSTFIVALAWVIPEGRFHEICLLIPSEVVPSIAGTSGPNYELHFRPEGSSELSIVDQFRLPLASLSEAISQRLG
jgi:hypothetical protein